MPAAADERVATVPTAPLADDRPGPHGHRSGGLIRGFATDANSVLERQLCTAGVYLLSLLLLFIPGVAATSGAAIAVSLVLITGATAAAFVVRAAVLPPRSAMIIPLVDILAVGFLRAGTGGPTSVYTLLLALPVISLGVEPGRLPMLLGGPVTVLALLLPVAFDTAPPDSGQWSRIIFGPIILGLICLSSNELTRRLRSRMRAVQRLQRRQESLLAEAEEHGRRAAVSAAQLREGAAALESVIDAVTEQSIIATDRGGRIDVFNAGAQKLLHVPARDAIGRPITGFHRPEELQGRDSAAEERSGTPFEALVAGVRDGGPQLGDWTYVTGRGADVEVRVAVTVRRDAAGEIDGFLFVATDVTGEREQARLKDEFVNLISHELRTPLSSILGYLELVADDEDNPLSVEQLRYLGTIERNANRLLRLVSDLLFTAQIESGRFQLQEQAVDLRVLLDAAIDSAAPQAAGRDVLLQLAEVAEPLVVWGDPVRLAQAVDNLISNAIKFTPPAGRVAVSLTGTGSGPFGGVGGGAGGQGGGDDAARPAPRALISVTDTGVGIPADELDRLFSRFFRASTATENAIPGVGLGLTITRAIASAHHGVVRVTSTVGEGTSFTLDLPQLVEATGR